MSDYCLKCWFTYGCYRLVVVFNPGFMVYLCATHYKTMKGDNTEVELEAELCQCYIEAIELLRSSCLSMREVWHRCARRVPYYKFVLELRYRYCKCRDDRELLRRRVCSTIYVAHKEKNR